MADTKKPTPLIETIFRFAGLEEQYEKVKKFGADVEKAMSVVGRSGEIVSESIGKAADQIRNGAAARKIKAAIADTIGPNVIGKFALGGIGGAFGFLAQAASIALAPIRKLWDVIKTGAGLVGSAFSLGAAGIAKIGGAAMDAGRMFVSYFKRGLIAAGGIAGAISTQLVTAANRIVGIGNDAAANGMSSQALSHLKSMVGGLGGNVENVTSALQTFRAQAAQAFADPASEAGQMFETFRKFGVSIVDETGRLRDVYDIVLQMREVFRSGFMTDRQQSALASQLFGQAGAEDFLRVMHQTDDQWRASARSAADAGNIITQEHVSIARSIKGAWTGLKDTVAGIGNKLLLSVGGPFSQLLSGIGNQLKNSGDSIVGLLTRVSYAIIGVVADLTAVTFSQDRVGYRFVNPWMSALAKLRDGFLTVVAVFKGDRLASAMNPDIVKAVSLIRDQLWPRLKAIGSGLFDFFGKIVLPVLTMITAAITALLPAFDFIGDKLQWLASKVEKLFTEIAAWIRYGSGSVDREWRWIVDAGEQIQWLWDKAKSFFGYMWGALRTVKDWNTVRLVSKREGLVGLQQRQQDGTLPQLDPKFAWIPKALTALETLYNKTTAAIGKAYAAVAEKLGPAVDDIKSMLTKAGSWLLDFLANLASYFSDGTVDEAFSWIPKIVDFLKRFIESASAAFQLIRALASEFRAFTQFGFNGVSDERFKGFFRLLDVIKKAFEVINSMVTKIGEALGLSGIQAQVAAIVLAFTGLGSKLMKVFGAVGKLIIAQIVKPLLKAVGMEALLALPKKVLAGIALAAGGAFLGDLTVRTGKTLLDPNATYQDLAANPGKAWNDVISPLTNVIGKLADAIIPGDSSDEFSARSFGGESNDEARTAYEYASGIRGVNMNETADDLPMSQRPQNMDTTDELTTQVTVNIEGRSASMRTPDRDAALSMAEMLQQIGVRDDMHSMRAIPVDH